MIKIHSCMTKTRLKLSVISAAKFIPCPIIGDHQYPSTTASSGHRVARKSKTFLCRLGQKIPQCLPKIMGHPGRLRRFHPPTCVFVGHRSSGRKQSPATNGKCKRSTCHGMSENLEAAKERWAWWFWCLHPFLPISLPPYLPPPQPNPTQHPTPPDPPYPSTLPYPTVPTYLALPTCILLVQLIRWSNFMQFQGLTSGRLIQHERALEPFLKQCGSMWVTVTILRLRHSLT